MPIARLTSRTNPVLKLMRAVISRHRRAPADLMPAEGVRILEEATRSGCSIEMAIISESFGENPREDALLRTWATRNTKIYRTTESLLNSLSEVRTPQGAIALVRVSQAHLEQQASSRPPLILCACNISDPGNLGTLIRSALAADATLVVTTPGSVSARGAKSVRASAGAVFHIPIVEQVSPERFMEYCAARNISVYRAAARAGLPHSRVNFCGGVAILLGNEGSGTAGENWPQAVSVHVPMAEGVESLNVAAAGAVLLLEAYRQRLQGTQP